MPEVKDPPVVAVHDLGVRYGTKVALSGVSLRVEKGQVYALLGRNGAGKSSLVRCLLGCQRPSSGRTRLMGRDSWCDRRRAMLGVGVVPEVPDAPRSMTVLGLDAFGARLYPSWNSDELRSRLGRAEIPLDVPFGRLSRGQRAQVALALALAQSPDVLVLDDPTLGLDAVARRDLLRELVGELADRDTTVLITSHDLGGVEAIADRVGMLHGGRLVVEDDLDALKSRFRRLVRLQPETDSRIPVPQGATAVSRQRMSLGEELVVSFGEPLSPTHLPSGISAETMSLEEIFIAVCGSPNGGAA